MESFTCDKLQSIPWFILGIYAKILGLIFRAFLRCLGPFHPEVTGPHPPVHSPLQRLLPSLFTVMFFLYSGQEPLPIKMIALLLLK